MALKNFSSMRLIFKLKMDENGGTKKGKGRRRGDRVRRSREANQLWSVSISTSKPINNTHRRRTFSEEGRGKRGEKIDGRGVDAMFGIDDFFSSAPFTLFRG